MTVGYIVHLEDTGKMCVKSCLRLKKKDRCSQWYNKFLFINSHFVCNPASKINFIPIFVELLIVWILISENKYIFPTRLVCKATQTDALGREVAVGLESLLTVKAPPPPEKVEGLGVAVIAIIVSCGAFLLLVLILLCVAFRTGRWCFKQPTQLVYIEKEANRAEQVSGNHLL